jgi:hypothetical protein
MKLPAFNPRLGGIQQLRGKSEVKVGNPIGLVRDRIVPTRSLQALDSTAPRERPLSPSPDAHSSI